MTKELVTKQRAKLINTAVEVAEQTPQEADTIAFMTKGFTVTTMPHSKVKGNTYVRTNGSSQLLMMAFPGQEIPYGIIPRLFVIWLITEIRRTKNNEITLGNNFS